VSQTLKKKTAESNRSLLDTSSEFFLDDEIVSRLKRREPQFLEALFVEVNPYLFRVCLSNSIRDEKAEDVIHRTWESFFENIDQFEGRAQIRTYICGILFNKIREHRREQGRTVYKEDSEEIFAQTFDAQGWWKRTPYSPHRILELRQASDLIEECLEGLSDQQRAAFVMKEVEDENSQQVCEILGVNVSHLRVLLFRAKDKLRMCLEGKVSPKGE